MVKKLLIILFPLIILCGCTATEPNDKYLVSLMGVEGSSAGVGLYYKYTDLADASLPKSVSGKGESLFEAAENINLFLDKMPALSHCEAVVLAEGIDKALFYETVYFCRKNELPLKLRLAAAKDIKPIFAEENTVSGVDVSGMLKLAYSTYGFGGHTALYEIETAINIGKDFALPYFEGGVENLKLGGLGLYKNCTFVKKIGINESGTYAKDNNISGEKNFDRRGQ